MARRLGTAVMLQEFLPFFPDVERHRQRLLQLLAESPPPVFVADPAILLARFEELQQCLAEEWGPAIIAYSFKTNYQVAQARLLQKAGAWAEVVSGREYRLARMLGYEGSRIIFNGPSKTVGQLQTALAEKACVNLNDHDELTRLLSVVGPDGAPHPVGIRLRPAIRGLPASRFGFSLENGEAERAVERVAASSRLRLAGVHRHLLGDTDDPACYADASRQLADFLRSRVSSPETLDYLDLGGGFPAHSPKPRRRLSWQPQPIAEYVRASAAPLRELVQGRCRPSLILEPGRYLVNDGLIFVSQVMAVRPTASSQDVTCNASISMLPLTHYRPQLFRPFDACLKPRTAPEVATTIYGSTCREDDVLFDGPMPPVEVGDHLVTYAVGAYNASLCPAFIFDPPALRVL